MALKKFTKDPDAVLDYTIDWSEWLAPGDVIVEASASVTPSGSLALDSDRSSSVEWTTTQVTVWLAGGTDGVSYEVAVHVKTNDGREDDRTLVIVVKDL